MQTDPFDDMRNDIRTRKTATPTYPRPVREIIEEICPPYAGAINTDAVANKDQESFIKTLSFGVRNTADIMSAIAMLNTFRG